VARPEGKHLAELGAGRRVCRGPARLAVAREDRLALARLGVSQVDEHGEHAVLGLAMGGELMSMPPVCFVWRIADEIYRVV
jgi:hypothetical protein